MKKQATPKSSPKKKELTRSLNESQRRRLLEGLREAGSDGMTTIQMQEELNIMRPGARICELRWDFNHNIQMIWDKAENAQGYEHRCGRYVLLSGKWRAQP